MTGFWLLMIVIGKPLKSKIGMIIWVLNSGIKLVLGVFAIVMVTNELNDSLDQDTGQLIGTVMIWIIVENLGLNTIISIGIVLHSIYQVGTNCCRRGKKKTKQYNFQLQSGESTMNHLTSNQ